jgi:YNFM family putative membrane transporter
MGAFVTTYNYVTYYLIRAAYRLSHTVVGFIFVVYLVGIFASAWIGSLADRVGRARGAFHDGGPDAAGDRSTVLRPLLVVVFGIAVSLSVLWRTFRGEQLGWAACASGEGAGGGAYLFFYYLGSSVAGSAGGVFWDMAGGRAWRLRRGVARSSPLHCSVHGAGRAGSRERT